MALRDSLKAASVARAKTRTERVEVPGGTVEVRGMMAGDQYRIGEVQRDHGARRSMAMAVALCCFEPGSDRPIWSANDGADLEEVANLDPAIFEPLRIAALRVSGLSEDAKGAEGKADGSETSSTSSPSPASSGAARSKSGAR